MANETFFCSSACGGQSGSFALVALLTKRLLRSALSDKHDIKEQEHWLMTVADKIDFFL